MRPWILASLFVLAAWGLSSGSAQAAERFDVKKAEAEVETHYAKAHPEIQEYILWTARTFGPGGLWLPEDASADLPADAREKRIRHLAKLFEESVPGLVKVAGYHLPDRDYDCRAKWMAVAALARQEADDAVPVLVSLVDHGNQNTRHWARAALSRLTGQDFKQDKQAWAQWWQDQGYDAIDEQYLKPAEAPAKK